MAFPRSVSEVGDTYQGMVADLTGHALAELGPALRRGRKSPVAWRDAVASIGKVLLRLQVRAAVLADPYLNDVLDAQGANPDGNAKVVAQAFADLTDGGGSWLQALVFAPNSVRPAPGQFEDWTRFDFVASSIVKTGITDTSRSSAQAAMIARPAVTGYVRMLRPPSCARCALLAGRHYRSSVAFRRHKRCDCIHVPTTEDSDDWTTNPVKYFRSLSTEEQDRIFTKAGARAIRDSGVKQLTINQVVNAREGITTVNAFGRDVLATTTGTTKRALFGGYEIREDGTLRKRADSELQKLPGRRYRTAKAPRLLPDQIYLLAEEFGWGRDEVLRQLRRFAYVI